MIKYNSNVIDKCNFSTSDVNEMWYNGKMCYKYFKADGEPTPPTPPSFDGKVKLAYSDGRVFSKECDGDSTLTTTTIRQGGGSIYTSITEAIIGNYCLTTIGKNAFSGCRSLTGVTIPNSVTSIGQNAFDSCTNLTNIVIPDSVTNIGGYAFCNCTSLTSVTIGSGVTSIGGFAFENCSSLTSIIIPNSVTTIDYAAFNVCTNLTSVTFGTSLINIGGSIFNNCRNVTTLTSYAVVPPSVGRRAFDDIRYSVTDVYVPDESLDEYKSASGWSIFDSRIKPLSEKPE